MVTIRDFEVLSWFQQEIEKVTQLDIEKPLVLKVWPPAGATLIQGKMKRSLKALICLFRKVSIEFDEMVEKVDPPKNGTYTKLDEDDLEDIGEQINVTWDRLDFLNSLITTEIHVQFPESDEYENLAFGPTYEVYGFDYSDDDEEDHAQHEVGAQKYH